MLTRHLLLVIILAQTLDGQLSRRRAAANIQPALAVSPGNLGRQARQGITSVFVSRQRPANGNSRPLKFKPPQTSLLRRPFSQPPVALPTQQRRGLLQPPPRQRPIALPPPSNRFNEIGSMPSIRPPKGVAGQLNRAKLKDFMSLGSFLMQRRRIRLLSI